MNKTKASERIKRDMEKLRASEIDFAKKVRQEHFNDLKSKAIGSFVVACGFVGFIVIVCGFAYGIYKLARIWI